MNSGFLYLIKFVFTFFDLNLLLFFQDIRMSSPESSVKNIHTFNKFDSIPETFCTFAVEYFKFVPLCNLTG